jgi:hypothetical protein
MDISIEKYEQGLPVINFDEFFKQLKNYANYSNLKENSLFEFTKVNSSNLISIQQKLRIF